MMEPTSFWAKLMEYGLAGVVIALLFWLIIKILVWVMAWVDKQAIQHAEERKSWKENQDRQNQILDKAVSSLARHDEKADERGKYVRDEHLKMLENQTIITACLKEVTSSLGRINGYKQ